MEYKYYAFISYSRKNNKAAAYLHKSLERFRIPVKYVAKEFCPDGQKYLRPIFRDRRDLEVKEGSFTNDIRTAIEQSRYLIVLCSPDTALSHWVNEEVKYFLATHNNDMSSVVPVILTGRPGSGGAEECLPPDLCVEQITGRNLSTMIPDEGDPEKVGWENGVVQALSYMLRVNREKIKATVDAEKMRLMRIRMIITMIVLFLFAGLTAWAIRAERKATANEQRAIAGEKLAQENEAKAKEQAEIAQKSLDFLRDMFQSSDPTTKGNKDMRVLDAIRAKLPEIEKLAPWQLRASVASDIGMVLSSLGEYDEALRLLNMALELNLKHRPESEETATSYNNIGLVYHKQKNFEKAIICFYKAQELALKLNAPASTLAIICNNLAMIYQELSNFQMAQDYYNMAQEYRQGSKGDKSSTFFCNLGAMYCQLGNYKKALEYFKKGLEISLKNHGELSPHTANIYSGLGELYFNRGDYDKALEYHKKTLEIRLKVLSENHSQTA